MSRKTLTQKKHADLLYYYFQTMADLGDKAPYTKKIDICAIAGEKVYISELAALQIINRLLKCPKTVKDATERVIKPVTK